MSNETTLDDVLALVAKATPGDWAICDGPVGYAHRVYSEAMPDELAVVCDVTHGKDASLIVAAVNYLRAHGDELRAALEDARRYRFVVGRGKLPLKTSQGYHYDYNAPCRTVDAAIDAAQEVGE